jgi:hypothetical protein
VLNQKQLRKTIMQQRIMNEKELDTRFQEAVDISFKMTQASLPQDVQLRLYACYKQATFGTLELDKHQRII